MRYRWVLFLVLFIGMYSTNYFTLAARKPLAASLTFTAMIISVYGLEKFYNRGPEKITDERVELIKMKSFYYGSVGFFVAFMYEMIWLASKDYESLVLLSKLFLFPLTVFLILLVGSKAYLEGAM